MSRTMAMPPTSTAALLSSLEPAELEDIYAILSALWEHRKFDQLSFFKAYDKQLQFVELGATKSERLLMAGNQEGKTHVGAYEMAVHLTGLYPPDWKGRRWDRPVHAWACGESTTVTRDASQAKLCGEPGIDEDFGTGFIPRSCFVGKPSLARGAVADAYDTIQVIHHTNGVADGISTCTFKSYEQGRKKFQAKGLDIIWCDEEPPEDIYNEIIARLTATGGMVFVTFTPLQGRTKVVNRYLDEPSPDRAVVRMGIKDALHIKPEDRELILSRYPSHQRAARAEGEPLLGSGAIFTAAEQNIIEPFSAEIPLHWAKLWGIDFGIDHPFAAVLMAWDRDLDIIHFLAEVRMADALIIQHARALRLVAANVPVAWPQDGDVRADRKTGQTMAELYREEKLNMIGEHATWPDGGNSTEAGVTEMQEREATAQLRISDRMTMYLEERRRYHRKNGLIVKLDDDLLSAGRICIMAKRFAVPVGLGPQTINRKRGSSYIAKGIDTGEHFGI